MKYKNLFIDLDDTLWDTFHNNKECLEELYADYHFDRHYSDAASFGKNSIADRKPYIYQAVAGAFIPFPGTYGIYA